MILLKIWTELRYWKKIVYGTIFGFIAGFLQWNIFNFIGLKIGNSVNNYISIFYVGSSFGFFYALILLVASLISNKNKKSSESIFNTAILLFILISIIMALFLLFVSTRMPIRDF